MKRTDEYRMPQLPQRQARSGWVLHLPDRRRGVTRPALLFRFATIVIGLSFVIPGSSFGAGDVEQQTTTTQSLPQRILRVAADPNNLPFSNQRLEGFENKIAELIGRELHFELEYRWRAQRRGFFRETLKQGNADLVMGVPAHFDLALTTTPYYRSSYVFVSRSDRRVHVTSFDDPKLHDLTIGVQLIGNDGMDTPPAHALAARGIVNNVRGFTLYGDYAQNNPPARIIDAVANGDVDIAIVWGPLAGYFARRAKVPLTLEPVSPQADGPLRFAFAVSLGVQKNNQSLKAELDKFLAGHREEIARILADYNIPQVQSDQQVAAAK